MKKIVKIFPDKGNFREVYTILIDEKRGIVDIYNKIEQYTDGTWEHDHQMGRLVLPIERFLTLFGDLITQLLPSSSVKKKRIYYWMSSEGKLMRINDFSEIQRIAGIHQNGKLPSDVVFQDVNED